MKIERRWTSADRDAYDGIAFAPIDSEVRNPDGGPFAGQPNHERLLCAGIPLVEYLANLQEFLNQRFTAFVLPVKVAGLEAFPVRVIGIEWEEVQR